MAQEVPYFSYTRFAVHREAARYLENKERRAKSCALRHGVSRLQTCLSLSLVL